MSAVYLSSVPAQSSGVTYYHDDTQHDTRHGTYHDIVLIIMTQNYQSSTHLVIIILLYSLSRNKIGDAGAKHLAGFFLSNNCKQLEKLRYSYNNILVVYAVVQNASYQTHLCSLQKIGLCDDGLSCLVQGLKCHLSLRELE